MALLSAGAALLTATILLTFSSVETRWVCARDFLWPTDAPPKVFMKIDQYRPWVRLWSDSEGAVWFEIHGGPTIFAPHVATQGEQLIFLADLASQGAGYFSKLSRSLYLNYENKSWLGNCEPQSTSKS